MVKYFEEAEAKYPKGTIIYKDTRDWYSDVKIHKSSGKCTIEYSRDDCCIWVGVLDTGYRIKVYEHDSWAKVISEPQSS